MQKMYPVEFELGLLGHFVCSVLKHADQVDVWSSKFCLTNCHHKVHSETPAQITTGMVHGSKIIEIAVCLKMFVKFCLHGQPLTSNSLDFCPFFFCFFFHLIPVSIFGCVGPLKASIT